MAYYKTCPLCGCNLDPGESCDCEEVKMEEKKKIEQLLTEEKETNQITFNWSFRGSVK